MASPSSQQQQQRSYEGERVRLVGLTTVLLCGAEGTAGHTDAATGRVCVLLDRPQAAVDAHPAGVKARSNTDARSRQLGLLLLACV
jgi:hypothetical protein